MTGSLIHIRMRLSFWPLFQNLVMHLVKLAAESHSPRVVVVNIYRRFFIKGRSYLVYHSNIHRIAHQVNRGCVDEYVGKPDQAVLQLRLGHYFSQLFRKADPISSSMHLYLRKPDRARTNIFMGVKLNFLNIVTSAFTMTSPQFLSVPPLLPSLLNTSMTFSSTARFASV